MPGRKAGSIIRKRISALIKELGKSYGYEIYKNYNVVFGNVDMRLVYYHLKSGVNRQEFIISEIKKEKGGYTWGDMAEKVYYDIGPRAELSSLTDKELGIIDKLKHSRKRV